jgi:transposase
MSNNTPKVKKLNRKSLIVAIDIGKSAHYGYFRAPDGTDIKPFVFYNTRKSFEQFWHKVRRFANTHGLKNIVIGFESTGPYAEPLFNYLGDKPAQLVQINPMHTKRIKDLTGNSPNKTDQKDPRVIADVIGLGHALTLVVPQGPAAQLRRLTQARERSIKKRTAALNQLQQLIFIIFPEFIDIMNDISTKTAFYLLKNYPSPEQLSVLGQRALAMAMKDVSRGRIGDTRAKALIKAAHHSVGVRHGQQALLLEIEHLVSEIEAQNRFVDQLETQMQHYLRQVPYSDNMLSIKGLATVTVAGLIGEVGDFKQFKTIGEITKLAGLDLFEISSGKYRGRRHISKRGRPLMRKLLFFASINTVKSGGIMHGKYQQMVDRGMVKMKALTAISRKLLAITFAVVRDDAKYVENYHRQHNYKLAA